MIRSMRPGRWRHDDDAVAHVNGFVDVMRNEQHGGPAGLPKAQDFILHPHAGEGVERAERFIEQKNFGMIDQGASQGDALRHAAGKMMRIGIGETLPSPQAHEFVHFMAFFAARTPRATSPASILRRTVSHGKRFGS